MSIFPIVKNRFPFSLGCTSYIIPADIIPNVTLLSPVVDDIELILFESSDFSNIPSIETISHLRDLSLSNLSSYTIHLPIDRKAGSEDRNERKLFCDSARQIIDLCESLNPVSWILHLEGISFSSDDKSINDWQKRCTETLNQLITHISLHDSVSIENLGYPWFWHQNIASQFGTSLCCDVGHLWLYFEQHWIEYLKAMLPKTKVIHLHGVANGKDHISLSEGNQDHIRNFLEIIRDSEYCGVITLEVFNENDLIQSIEVINKLWAE